MLFTVRKAPGRSTTGGWMELKKLEIRFVCGLISMPFDSAASQSSEHFHFRKKTIIWISSLIAHTIHPPERCRVSHRFCDVFAEAKTKLMRELRQSKIFMLIIGRRELFQLQFGWAKTNGKTREASSPTLSCLAGALALFRFYHQWKPLEQHFFISSLPLRTPTMHRQIKAHKNATKVPASFRRIQRRYASRGNSGECGMFYCRCDVNECEPVSLRFRLQANHWHQTDGDHNTGG